MQKHSIVLLVCVAAAMGCSKKEGSKSADKANTPSAPSSGPAWKPDNYDQMSTTCKKALACCVEAATKAGTTSAEELNGKCSGPAMWPDDGCKADIDGRIAVLESTKSPIPDACK